MARRGGSGLDDTLVTLGIMAVLYIGVNDYTVHQTGMTPYQWIKQQLRGITPSGGGSTGLKTDPEMQQVMVLWQHTRCEQSLEPNDWAAFRSYEQQRGYSTPQYAPAGWGYTCGGSSYY